MEANPSLPQGTRRAPRSAVRIECVALSDAWDEDLTLEIRDLSPFGLWIPIDYPLPVGDELVLHFRLPGSHPRSAGIVAHAMVVRTSLQPGAGGMALEFLELSEGAFVALSTALERRPPPITRAARARARSHGHLAPVRNAANAESVSEPPLGPHDTN